MLVTIDGGDFSGKSTVISELCKILEGRGHKVIISRTSLCQGLVARIVEFAQDRSESETIKGIVFHGAYFFDLFCKPPRDSIFIQETSWVRVYAYDCLKRRNIGKFFLKLIRVLLPHPDVAVFLEVDFCERYKRYLASELKSDFRDKIRFSSKKEFHKQFIETYRKLAKQNGAKIIKNMGQESLYETVFIILALVEKKRAVS